MCGHRGNPSRFEQSGEKPPKKTFSVALRPSFVERSLSMNARPARSGVRKSPATIWDVARAAGVSVGTVSKALNGRGQLREETRALVRSTAERLGFRPNDLAQSLLRKRSFTVGLISTDAYGRFSIPVLEGIESALEPVGESPRPDLFPDGRDPRVRMVMYGPPAARAGCSGGRLSPGR